MMILNEKKKIKESMSLQRYFPLNKEVEGQRKPLLYRQMSASK